MFKFKFGLLFSTILTLNSAHTLAMASANGEFVVGLGPVEIGGVSMSTSCIQDTCSYEARVKGSFMFIGADINEKGSYKQLDFQVAPISSQYKEKIGSKRKAFSYDFQSMEIEDQKSHRTLSLPDNVYPFMPLLNQVILDLKNGGPREYYEFLSKHKVKKAIISAYTKTDTEHGVLHRFIGKQKESELEFFFIQNGEGINLQKIAYGSFHMSRRE